MSDDSLDNASLDDACLILRASTFQSVVNQIHPSLNDQSVSQVWSDLIDQILWGHRGQALWPTWRQGKKFADWPTFLRQGSKFVERGDLYATDTSLLAQNKPYVKALLAKKKIHMLDILQWAWDDKEECWNEEHFERFDMLDNCPSGWCRGCPQNLISD